MHFSQLLDMIETPFYHQNEEKFTANKFIKVSDLHIAELHSCEATKIV
jgi:hypothetical protein